LAAPPPSPRPLRSPPDSGFDSSGRRERKRLILTHLLKRSWRQAPALERPCSAAGRPAPAGPGAWYVAPARAGSGWFPPGAGRRSRTNRPAASRPSRERRAASRRPNPSAAYKQIGRGQPPWARVALQQGLMRLGLVRSGRRNRSAKQLSHRVSPTAWLIARATAGAGRAGIDAPPVRSAEGGESLLNAPRKATPRPPDPIGRGRWPRVAARRSRGRSSQRVRSALSPPVAIASSAGDQAPG